MVFIRALVFGATVALALTPLAASAATDTSHEHAAAEVANGFAQLNLAEQEVADMQAAANLSAANDRMIAVLKSSALRERQLNLVSNATAMEQIAAALANVARASGDVNARNDIAIAQIKAAALVARADANVANALAIGRVDEIANANAQAQALHSLADFITGQMTEMNIANDKEIAQDEADAIHTPALVEEENGIAMGANDVLEADDVLAAGELNAISDIIGPGSIEAAILAHAEDSLRNAEAQEANAP